LKRHPPHHRSGPVNLFAKKAARVACAASFYLVQADGVAHDGVASGHSHRSRLRACHAANNGGDSRSNTYHNVTPNFMAARFVGTCGRRRLRERRIPTKSPHE